MATILIVDDIRANREFLATLLRDDGQRVIEASNGSEALAAIRTEPPDLVITDVLMPVMDGYELVRRLRLDPATSGIPVVFFTAHYSQAEARAVVLSGGVSDVLIKPADPAEVLRLVDRLLPGATCSTGPGDPVPAVTEFGREHIRLLTDTLAGQAGDLRTANVRLRALINIGLELASERDSGRLLQNVCTAACDLFGATYVTLGILDLNDRSVAHFVTCGTPAEGWVKPGDAVSGMLATIIAERRTMRGDNPGGDAAKLDLPALHPEVQAFLAAPIASPAHVYGWICFVGNEGRTFSEDDEHLVTALSGQVGRIYETSYFASMAQRRADELEREVLERKHAESALREERDRSQRYLDTAEVVLLALDLEGRITLINRKGSDLLGWTEHDLLGCDFLETCLPARTRVALRNEFQKVIDGDLSVVETPVITRSGEERCVEWHNTVLRDDHGCAIGTFSSGADITNRKQALEAVRTAEERTRYALEASGVGIWDMDFTTGVLQWSEILEAQYGLQPGAFGRTFEEFVQRVHPQDRSPVLETMARASRSGADFSVQHRVVRPDGTLRWLSGAGRIRLGPQGQPLRGVGISQDVTARRMLEEQYQQAQKMEAVGRLAGGVAHDFNNLLTAILGYCELLLTDLEPGDARQADITEIQKAGMRAAGLTRQLLAFSRKQIIEPTLLDLNVVVSDMRAMLTRLIGEDIKVVLTLRPQPALVTADHGQIEQIVLNLAVNARDAMPTGGTLTIETAYVELDENYAPAHYAVKPGSYVVLSVTDTGTGMTPEVQARLFEPFFTTKELGKGTGLGLATVHGIVAQSGGSVNAYSELGKGTAFKVYFPRAAAEVLPVPVPRPTVRPRGGTQTVLLVEDAEGLRELAKRLLQRQGYKVLVAANASEAIRLFEEHTSIDVLLTDVVMPGASGPELTRQLVERRPTLKVIYMSGYTEETIVQHGVLNKGIAFLHKPFTSETLGRKVREVIDRDVDLRTGDLVPSYEG